MKRNVNSFIDKNENNFLSKKDLIPKLCNEVINNDIMNDRSNNKKLISKNNDIIKNNTYNKKKKILFITKKIDCKEKLENSKTINSEIKYKKNNNYNQLELKEVDVEAEYNPNLNNNLNINNENWRENKINNINNIGSDKVKLNKSQKFIYEFLNSSPSNNIKNEILNNQNNSKENNLRKSSESPLLI